jgi:apolipoprotein N-acyltransferase
MKRARLMLVAIAAVAAIGGALAFKAQKFSFTYCTRATAANAGLCQGSIENSKKWEANHSNTTTYYYVLKPEDKACTNAGVQCPNSTSFVSE